MIINGYVISIDSYVPATPMRKEGHPDTWAPEEPAELEFTVEGYDITEEEREELYYEVLAELEQNGISLEQNVI